MSLTRPLCLTLSLMLTVACSPAEPSRPPEPTPTPAESGPGSERPGPPAADGRPVVLFLGTSLTAGMGIDPERAFPALVQERIEAAGLELRVVNAGVSGDTSAGGLARLDWLLRLPVRALVLELGANDMLRGQDPAALRANLETIIERTRALHPDAAILISGMQAAPNLGEDYGDAFAAVFTALARDQDAALIPFLLDGVAGEPELNLPDGMHPNPAGHERIARTVWTALEPLLDAQAESRPAKVVR